MAVTGDQRLDVAEEHRAGATEPQHLQGDEDHDAQTRADEETDVRVAVLLLRHIGVERRGDRGELRRQSDDVAEATARREHDERRTGERHEPCHGHRR